MVEWHRKPAARTQYYKILWTWRMAIIGVQSRAERWGLPRHALERIGIIYYNSAWLFKRHRVHLECASSTPGISIHSIPHYMSRSAAFSFFLLQSIEEVFQREASKQERRRRDRCRQQEAAFKKECPFTPTRFSSSAPIASTVRSRCPNDTAAEDQDAPAASGAEENIQIGGEGEGNVVVGWGAPAARSRSPI